jgi:hypothetical protein
MIDFDAVASEGNAYTEDRQLADEGQVFRAAGRVLGVGLACGANIVDPELTWRRRCRSRGGRAGRGVARADGRG